MGSGIMKRRHKKKIAKHLRHKKLRHPKKTNKNSSRRLAKKLGIWSSGKKK